MGQRSGDPDAEPELRQYLLDEAIGFRKLMTETLLDDGPESAQVAWVECSKTVDRLAAGLPCSIHRYELPDGHPLAPPVGHPSDSLELGIDDVLRDIEAKRDFWRRRDRAGQ